MVCDLYVFASGHTAERMAEVPDLPWVGKAFLPDLVLCGGKIRNGPKNSLAEGRLFLADLPIPDGVNYVGQFNARAHRKYSFLRFDWNTLPEHLGAKLKPHVVIAPWRVSGETADWVAYSESQCPGMGDLIKEMADVSASSLEAGGKTLWANDFICYRRVWDDFVRCFRLCVNHVRRKYRGNLPFTIKKDLDPTRKSAYLYERIATMYFANRRDLEVVQF